MRIEGQTSYEELLSLHDAARHVGSHQAIVEIGSYRGRSTVALALGALAGTCRRVYAVDPHVDFIGPCGGHYGPVDQQALYANLARFGVGHVVFAVALPGKSAAAGWPGPPVGLLWIDGDHRYESVRADLAAWYPHLAADGLIGFHDVDYAGVATVIGELVASGEFQEVCAAGRLKLFARTVLFARTAAKGVRE
ncbi:MAG: class I SAM-dependent methyltransferase [Pirellulales bacterium]